MVRVGRKEAQCHLSAFDWVRQNPLVLNPHIRAFSRWCWSLAFNLRCVTFQSKRLAGSFRDGGRDRTGTEGAWMDTRTLVCHASHSSCFLTEYLMPSTESWEEILSVTLLEM